MRKPNIAYNAQKLDDAIREIDGGRYNKSNISTFICGCANTYYNGCMSDGKISEEALKKICKFYGLKFKDYLEVPKPEPVAPETPVDQKSSESTSSGTVSNIPAPVVNIDLSPIVAGLENISKFDEKQSSAIMAQLLAMNKAVNEAAAQQKSTNYLIAQMLDKLGTINKHIESLDSLITNRENKFGNKSNTVKKFG